MIGNGSYPDQLNKYILKPIVEYLHKNPSASYLKKVTAIVVAACFILNIAGPAIYASNQELPGEKEKKERERIEYVLSNPNIPFTPAAIAQLKVKVEPNGVISAFDTSSKTWRSLGYWNGENAYTPKADGKFSKEGNEGLRQACVQYFKNHNVPVDVTVIKKESKVNEQVSKEKRQEEAVSGQIPAPPDIEESLKAISQTNPLENIINIQSVSQLLDLLKLLTDSASQLSNVEKDRILSSLSNQFGIAINVTQYQLKSIYSFLVQFFANGGSIINCAVQSLSSLLGIADTAEETTIGVSLLLIDIFSGTFDLAKSTAQNQIFTSASAIQTLAKINGVTLNAYQTDLSGLQQALQASTGGVILYLANHFVTATAVIGNTIYYLDNGIAKTMTASQWLNDMGGTILTSATIAAKTVSSSVLNTLTGAYVTNYSYFYNSATGMVYLNGQAGYLSPITNQVYSVVNNILTVNADMTYYATSVYNNVNNITSELPGAFSTFIQEVQFAVNLAISISQNQALTTSEQQLKMASVFATLLGSSINLGAIANLSVSYLKQVQNFLGTLSPTNISFGGSFNVLFSQLSDGWNSATSAGYNTIAAAGMLVDILTQKVNMAVSSGTYQISQAATNLISGGLSNLVTYVQNQYGPELNSISNNISNWDAAAFQSVFASLTNHNLLNSVVSYALNGVYAKGAMESWGAQDYLDTIARMTLGQSISASLNSAAISLLPQKLAEITFLSKASGIENLTYDSASDTFSFSFNTSNYQLGARQGITFDANQTVTAKIESDGSAVISNVTFNGSSAAKFYAKVQDEAGFFFHSYFTNVKLVLTGGSLALEDGDFALYDADMAGNAQFTVSRAEAGWSAPGATSASNTVDTKGIIKEGLNNFLISGKDAVISLRSGRWDVTGVGTVAETGSSVVIGNATVMVSAGDLVAKDGLWYAQDDTTQAYITSPEFTTLMKGYSISGESTALSNALASATGKVYLGLKQVSQASLTDTQDILQEVAANANYGNFTLTATTSSNFFGQFDIQAGFKFTVESGGYYSQGAVAGDTNANIAAITLNNDYYSVGTSNFAIMDGSTNNRITAGGIWSLSFNSGDKITAFNGIKNAYADAGHSPYLEAQQTMTGIQGTTFDASSNPLILDISADGDLVTSSNININYSGNSYVITQGAQVSLTQGKFSIVDGTATTNGANVYFADSTAAGAAGIASGSTSFAYAVGSVSDVNGFDDSNGWYFNGTINNYSDQTIASAFSTASFSNDNSLLTVPSGSNFSMGGQTFVSNSSITTTVCSRGGQFLVESSSLAGTAGANNPAGVDGLIVTADATTGLPVLYSVQVIPPTGSSNQWTYDYLTYSGDSSDLNVGYQQTYTFSSDFADGQERVTQLVYTQVAWTGSSFVAGGDQSKNSTTNYTYETLSNGQIVLKETDANYTYSDLASEKASVNDYKITYQYDCTTFNQTVQTSMTYAGVNTSGVTANHSQDRTEYYSYALGGRSALRGHEHAARVAGGRIAAQQRHHQSGRA